MFTPDGATVCRGGQCVIVYVQSGCWGQKIEPVSAGTLLSGQIMICLPREVRDLQETSSVSEVRKIMGHPYPWEKRGPLLPTRTRFRPRGMPAPPFAGELE